MISLLQDGDRGSGTTTTTTTTTTRAAYRIIEINFLHLTKAYYDDVVCAVEKHAQPNECLIGCEIEVRRQNHHRSTRATWIKQKIVINWSYRKKRDVCYMKSSFERIQTDRASA
jgi:hypothetical protein